MFASILRVCGNGGIHGLCPVSFCRRLGVSFWVSCLGCPLLFCDSLNIFLFIVTWNDHLSNYFNCNDGDFEDGSCACSVTKSSLENLRRQSQGVAPYALNLEAKKQLHSCLVQLPCGASTTSTLTTSTACPNNHTLESKTVYPKTPNPA